MNKTLSFVKLDYMTIKTYLSWKTVLLFLVVFAFMGYGTGEVSALIGVAMMYSTIFACYPFAIGDKNGIDTLYATLPITKKTVVTGRYAFSLLLNGFMAAASFGVSAILMPAFGKTFHLKTTLLTVLLCFALFSILEAVQLPLYFKLGYARAKFLAYLPLAVFPAAVLGASSLLGKGRMLPIIESILTWSQNNIIFTAVFAVVIWASAMLLSGVLSFRFYQKREF